VRQTVLSAVANLWQGPDSVQPRLILVTTRAIVGRHHAAPQSRNYWPAPQAPNLRAAEGSSPSQTSAGVTSFSCICALACEAPQERTRLAVVGREEDSDSILWIDALNN